MLRRTTRVLMGCMTKGIVHFFASLSYAGAHESLLSGPLHTNTLFYQPVTTPQGAHVLAVYHIMAIWADARHCLVRSSVLMHDTLVG